MALNAFGTGDAETTRRRPLAWEVVEWLTYLWHFVIPVLDDITDVVLLSQTYNVVHEGLWWTCLAVMLVAEVERLYLLLIPLCFGAVWVMNILLTGAEAIIHVLKCTPHDVGWVLGSEPLRLDFLNFGQEYDDVKLQFDLFSWVLFGSRARSSDLMSHVGLADQDPARVNQERGRGLRAIDVLVRHHPFSYLGEVIFWYPYGHHIPGQEGDASRRDVAMTRAVGETLVVDTLFLVLGVAASGWDENLTGLAGVSAVFSIVELVSELQYYAGIAVRSMQVARHHPEDAGAPLPLRVSSGRGQDAHSSV